MDLVDEQENRMKTFCLGRNQPIAKGPRLSMKNYTLKSLPSPPKTLD